MSFKWINVFQMDKCISNGEMYFKWINVFQMDKCTSNGEMYLQAIIN